MIRRFFRVCPNALAAAVLLSYAIARSGIPADSAASVGIPAAYAADTVWDTMTLAAVGDIMAHMPQVNAARAGPGYYDFSPAFEHVAPLLREADIVTGNLETVLSDNRSLYRGYPAFCSPYEIGCDLARAGFTMVTTANNHSYDRGEKGVMWTLDMLDSAGLEHTGTARGYAEAVSPLIVDARGIRTAVLAYTAFLNGRCPPPGKAYLVNLFFLDRLRNDVNAARERGAEFVVCCLHYGTEYVRAATREQKRIADSVVSCGVDLLLGSHPHVVSSMRLDSAGAHAAVYSLGNFFSNQRGGYKDYGTIVFVTVVRATPPGRCRILSVRHEPTYVDIRFKGKKRTYRVVPLRLVESDSAGVFAEIRPVVRGKYREMLDHIAGIKRKVVKSVK